MVYKKSEITALEPRSPVVASCIPEGKQVMRKKVHGHQNLNFQNFEKSDFLKVITDSTG